jgi:excisionase family DNA binding protein
MLTNILTTKELSEILKIKPKTLYQWAALGQIPCFKLNGAVRFNLDDVLQWVKTCEKGYNASAQTTRGPKRR